MEYLKSNYHVIGCNDLTAWLRGETKLPPNPALITFDDGYYDNMSNAYPILKEYGLTAIIFLAAGYMGSHNPFYWDLIAYCFYHSGKDTVLLPSGERLSWVDGPSRDRAVNRWVGLVKYFQEDEKRKFVDDLLKELDVAIPDNAFDGLYLTWDQVRELNNGVIEFGAHTVSHPILTRVPIDQAEKELIESKRRVEEEIGAPVKSLAYPNGGSSDFSSEMVDLVKKIGFELAFTLVPGPASYRTVRENPLTIPRIFLGASDTMPRFAAKLIGAEKVQDAIESILGRS